MGIEKSTQRNEDKFGKIDGNISLALFNLHFVILRRKKASTFKKKLKIIGIGFVVFLVLSLAVSVGAYLYWVEPYLPETSKIRDVSLSEPMKIYTKDGSLISQIGIRKRYIITYEDIPQQLIDSLLVIEDNRFYEHFGVDIVGLVRAFITLVRTGEKRQGASTLTMQLARNLFLTREKSFLRKFREIFLALRLETVFSKNEILTLYINRVFLGHRSYGFQAAAQTYFGKNLKQLSLAELALLAGLPKAPSAFNPLSNVSRAKLRRDYILLRLRENAIIDDETYQLALSEPIKPKKFSAPVDVNAGHVADMAQREAVSILRNKGIIEGIYEQGIKVITTVSSTKQRSAYAAVQQGVLDYIRRHQWSGVEKTVDIELVEGDSTWQKLSLKQRQNMITFEQNQNYLVGLTQQIDYIDGLLRAVIYHSKGNQVFAMLENNQSIQLSKKDIAWARNTWTRETSEDYKLTQLSKQIKEDIDALLEQQNSEVYFSPHLSSAIRRKKQKHPLPLGGLIYVRAQHLSKKTNNQPSKVYKLYSKPKVQAALVSLDVRTGGILSLVGGFNYHNYKFNRVIQSERQPGSNFKPFLYAAALDKGMTAATIVDDIPISFEDKQTGFIWTPNNYSKKYFGATRLRDALTYSRNLVSVKLMTQIGLNHTIKYMTNFGFKKEPFVQHRNLSISLGSAPLSPMAIARGYAVFANGGYLVEPYLIHEIQDGSGQVIYRYQPARVCYQDCDEAPNHEISTSSENITPEVTSNNHESLPVSSALYPNPVSIGTSFTQMIDPDISYIITDILQDVIKRGTGRRAKVLKRQDIAGKTGTTNDHYDAWFSGYNHSMATTVWVGYDTPRSMGNKETGGRAALPIWINYMREALVDSPAIELPRSNNLIDVRISKKTGLPVQQLNNNEPTMFEVFRTQYINNAYLNNGQTPTPSTDLPPPNNATTNPAQDNLLKKLF